MSDPADVERATAQLERWLDGMRMAGGYGGPVVHWWRDSLLYCGPGLDWRYEGIIDGYVTLFERTGRADLLEKARRAGDDLAEGQLADGTYRNSSFERNPRSGGTPHEAAADIGLLLLARTLRAQSDPDWQHYLQTAEGNIRRVLVGRLWIENQRRFGDGGGWFVPNKAATIIEAICLLAELSGQDEYLTRYAAPTAEAIVAHQLSAPNDPLDGAIAQASLGRRRIEKYFPYYAARAIPGLCAAYRLLDDERYIEAALKAGAFIVRWRDEDGAWPQVIYRGGRVNRYPRWIAGAGDILRALELLRSFGLVADQQPTIRWILGGQLPSGALRVAEGFGSQVTQRPPSGPMEIRDVLPVVGWNDKAFRALATLAVNVVDAPTTSPVELKARWRGRDVLYREDTGGVAVTAGRSQLYAWDKHQPWALWDGMALTDER